MGDGFHRNDYVKPEVQVTLQVQDLVKDGLLPHPDQCWPFKWGGTTHATRKKMERCGYQFVDGPRRLAEIQETREVEDHISHANVLTASALFLGLGLLCIIKRCFRKRNEGDN